jgi:transposase
MTCVVDHDTGRLVWAAEGRNTQTLLRFFDALGAERAGQLTHVSADGADWIHTVVAEKAPQAVLCLDPFHVVAWGTAAVDQVRRGLVAGLRATGRRQQATSLKGTRWALVKNPASLTGDQRTRLAQIAVTNKSLYRAYLLKEQLRAVFETKGHHGRLLLAGWLAWAKRSRISAFTRLAATIDRYGSSSSTPSTTAACPTSGFHTAPLRDVRVVGRVGVRVLAGCGSDCGAGV